ncbi:MAG TPA: GlxA family transcriptional regulator [Candidatus Binataceae bacterium]|nr:GlxA family transcriptional regulator [Candidatus Binataceae bacterium]
MLAFPDAQILDIAGPLEVFSRASRWLIDEGLATAPAYEVCLVAAARGPLAMSSGLKFVVEESTGDLRSPVDTLMVAGGLGTFAAMRDQKLIAWLRKMAPRARRLCSVCTGTFLLAEAGLLNGRCATTHWRACELLQRRFPAIKVQTDPIFVRDGRVYTSAGVTAGIDLALALLEEDHGRRVALGVARELVMFLRRPGGQSQFSVQLSTQSADREPIRELQAWIADHVSAGLSVGALARRAAMSARNFARVFLRETGMTPATFVELARVEAARRRLEESADSIDAIALSCGFGTRESMRRAFIRALRVPPSAYRSRFRPAPAAETRRALKLSA